MLGVYGFGGFGLGCGLSGLEGFMALMEVCLAMDTRRCAKSPGCQQRSWVSDLGFGPYRTIIMAF